MRLLLCVYKTEQGMTSSNGETWSHRTNLCLPFDVTVMLNLSIVVLFRYVEKNTRCHSLYRPYSNDVPVYLHDKPKPVIDTARHKISLAEEIPAPDALPRMLLSFATCTYSAQFLNEWHNN